MFAAEFEPAEMNGRRRSARAPVSLDARLGKSARALCRVVDISAHGARIQTYSGLKRGEAIWLTLPGIGQHSAQVMWADDFVAGCQFHKPLDDATFDALVAHDGVATSR